MSAADEILKQRRAELARRFLERSHTEALVCRAQLSQADKLASWKIAAELKMFAHKIKGTGATLGMDSLSDLAGELEALLSTRAGGERTVGADLDALQAATERLFHEIERRLTEDRP